MEELVEGHLIWLHGLVCQKAGLRRNAATVEEKKEKKEKKAKTSHQSLRQLISEWDLFCISPHLCNVTWHVYKSSFVYPFNPTTAAFL